MSPLFQTWYYGMLHIKNYLRGPYSIGSEKYDSPPPVEYKWLPGDVLDAGFKTVSRNVRPLHGILDLTNRTGQGFTTRGVPLYLFYPLDPAWPPFLVSYKERKSENLLATIQYEHWNSGRWPRGGILKIHGSVGNIELERRLLCDTYDVNISITL